jgi:DNA repair protein RadD
VITLRPHQLAAVASVYPLEDGDRKLIVIPTGGGKSLIAGQLACDAVLFGRVLIVTHVSELVDQNTADLRKLASELDVGVYCSKLKAYESGKPVTVASIQSIFRKLDLWDDLALIIVDEAHRISPAGGKMYRALLKAFPNVPVVGLTATPYRMGSGYLHKGEGAIFKELSYEVAYDQLVADGWLSPFAERGSDIAYDPGKTRIQAGEFVQKELDTLVDYPKTKRIVEQALARSKDRKHKLCFAINLRHCDIVQQVLNELGLTSVILRGDMDSQDRKDARYLFELGLIDVAINCNIWGTGYNFPALDCIWLLRPIASVGFFIQVAGRLTRTAEGKTDGLLLDYGGNVSRHGHFSKPEVKEKGNGKGAMKQCSSPECGEKNSINARYCRVCKTQFQEMFKDCPKCDTQVDIMTQTCPKCSYGWPVNEAKLDEEGSTILPNTSTWVNVESWNFRIHEKAGSPYKSLCVSYKTVDHGMMQEYVFPEHPATKDSFAKWWRLHGKDTPLPKTAQAAYGQRQQLDMPDRVRVIRSGKFYVFLGRTFDNRRGNGTNYKQTSHSYNGGSQPSVQQAQQALEAKLLDNLPY